MATATLEARQLMLKGLARAEGAHKEALDCAKWLAELIGNKQPTVTADDVFQWIDPKALGPAAGAIFRDGTWEFSHWQESTRETNHGRPLRAWRLSAGRES